MENTEFNFNIDSKDLSNLISEVIWIIPKNSPLSILQYAKFIYKNNCLVVVGSNLEAEISSICSNVRGTGSVTFCTDVRRLQETLKTIEGNIEVYLKNEKIQFKTESGLYSLPYISGDDFPGMQKEDTEITIGITAGNLINCLSSVYQFTSVDTLKVALSGVCFTYTKTGSDFVATDAHSLSIFREPHLKSTDCDWKYLIPRIICEVILKNLAKLETDISVKLTMSKRDISIKYEGTEITGRLIDATYPDYNSVIPLQSSSKVIVNRKDLEASLRRLCIYSPKSTHLVRLEFFGNTIEMITEDIGEKSAQETITAWLETPIQKIGFDATKLLKIIQNLKTDEIWFELETESSAVLFREVGGTENQLTQLLMPVLID